MNNKFQKLNNLLTFSSVGDLLHWKLEYLAHDLDTETYLTDDEKYTKYSNHANEVGTSVQVYWDADHSQVHTPMQSDWLVANTDIIFITKKSVNQLFITKSFTRKNGDQWLFHIGRYVLQRHGLPLTNGASFAAINDYKYISDPSLTELTYDPDDRLELEQGFCIQRIKGNYVIQSHSTLLKC